MVWLPLTVMKVVVICCVALETEIDVVRKIVEVESWSPPRGAGEDDEGLSDVVAGAGRALVLEGGGGDDLDVVGASGGADDDGGGAAELDGVGGGADVGGGAADDGGSDDVGVLRLSDDGVLDGSLVVLGRVLEEARLGGAELGVLLGA